LSGFERGLPILLSCKIDNEIRSRIYPITSYSHDSSVVAKYKRKDQKMKNMVLLVLLALVACGENSSDEGSPGTSIRQVPRNRTLIMDCAETNTCAGQIQDYNSFNPYLPGTTSRTGYNFAYEPLYFYNAFKGEMIPWIATGHEFNEDFTEVVIHIRPGVTWSDGVAWTADDLVFTVNMLRENAPELTYSTDMENWVESAVAVDSLTARIVLTAPNPRFVFSYFTSNFGIGVPIVPQHVWQGKDPNTFTNFDMQKGWPVFTGPYQMVLSTPRQRIWDLRQGWWAAEAGFQEMPKVERIIYLTYLEEAKRVQNLITNHMDTSLTSDRPIFAPCSKAIRG